MPCAYASPAMCAASVSAMSIPDETPAAVITLPCSTTRRETGVAPNLASASSTSQCVVASSPSRMPAAPSTSEPLHRRLVGRQRPRAPAAREHDHVGVGHVGQRAVGVQREHRVLGPLGTGL